MKFTFKIAVEIKRSQPCSRPHCDEPPEQLPSVTEATVERAPSWDFEARSQAVAAKFGFGRPAPSCTREATS